jgi:peroxiredoxin
VLSRSPALIPAVVISAALVAAIGSAALTGCDASSYLRGPNSVKAAVKPEKERKAAPDFTLKDATGQTVKLSDFRGKVVLLNFWATWCEPCQLEIPWFMDFQQSYKDRDFVVLGASMDDDGWDSVKPYLQARKINYRIVIANEEISGKYGGIENLPTTFIIDREGRIAATHVGLVSKSTYQNDILNLLDE